ncbi:MAG TPA: VOC family protein, partial [Microthrixaceae bacterium]|nr:VOC family protein [Microthrixaceae bacterium]
MSESRFRLEDKGALDSSSPDHPGHGIGFHHVSLAVRHPTDLWPILAGSLGGRYVGRGIGPGYGWTQLQFANGFRVEGIHPETNPSGGDATETERGFVADYLDKFGVGPHHLTFRVSEFSTVVDRLRSAGFEVFERHHVEPFEWKEAIIRAQDAHGTMVQLLDGIHNPTILEDPPEGFPESDFDRQIASLARVVHAVRDLPGALSLYRDLLGGKVVSTGAAIDGNHWVELGWGGPGRLRLLEGVHAEIAKWIGDRTGRTRHLFFNFDEPSYVQGAKKVASGRWV